MKDFQLIEYLLDEALAEKLRPIILDAMLEHLRETDGRGRSVGGAWRLTVTQAKEILAIRQPALRAHIPHNLESLPTTAEPLPGNAEIGNLVHKWLDEAALFLRQEGSAILLQCRDLPQQEAKDKLWGAIFDRKVWPNIIGGGYLESPEKVDAANSAIECMKRWSAHMLSEFRSQPADLTPQAFFLDTETDVMAEVEHKGQRISLVGKPDLVMLNSACCPCIIDYKFGLQGQIELQLAQLVLYGIIVEKLKGTACKSGRLLVFSPFEVAALPDAKYPPEVVIPDVDEAFSGFIGNEQAVQRVKVVLTLALRNSPPLMPVNFMFCGSAGLGKTEIARRVATALKGLPMVEQHAKYIASVDDLIESVDKKFAESAIEIEELPADAGRDVAFYPPFVLFIDEVHLLGKKADEFLPLFEPNERKAKGKKYARDFKNATILVATTDRGKLPQAFLTRFRMVDLKPYSIDELALILKPVFVQNGIDAPDAEVLRALVIAGRLNPRVAKGRTEEFISWHIAKPNDYPVTAAAVNKMALEVWDLKAGSLTRNDLLYMQALADGKKGESSLLGLLQGIGREEVFGIIEPYLLSAGYVRTTSQGRELTESGRLLLSRL